MNTQRSVAGAQTRRWIFRTGILAVAFLWLLLSLAPGASAQTNMTAGFGPVQITLGTNNGTQDVDSAIKILCILTLLSLAPAILLLMTCFTRVVIVLSFVRTALQLQGAPANQIIVGLSLFITYFVMAPVLENINRDALAPYQARQIAGVEAINRASGHIRAFMLREARPKDVELFAAMAKIEKSSIPNTTRWVGRTTNPGASMLTKVIITRSNGACRSGLDGFRFSLR